MKQQIKGRKDQYIGYYNLPGNLSVTETQLVICHPPQLLTVQCNDRLFIFIVHSLHMTALY